jgi:hypothetical protein
MMRIAPEYASFTSYRCEAFGMLSALTMYDKLQLFTKSITGNRVPTEIKIYCDNEALVNIINRQSWTKYFTKFHSSPDANVLREIIHLMREISSQGEQIHICHIKGHQVRVTQNLSYEASLNVAADATATESLALPAPSTPIKFLCTIANIYIKGKLVSSKFKSYLREAYRLVPHREHINQINNWDPSVFDLVWWDIYGRALDKFNINQQLMLQKYFQN